LGYIWLDRKARDLKDICQIIKNAIKDIQRQSNKEKNERKSFDLVKQEWGKELCIDRCNMKELGCVSTGSLENVRYMERCTESKVPPL
jgi:hypothetical protein